MLSITAAIPAGRVSTYKAVGDYLDVMPRHVAYILSNLSDPEKDQIPWHRVVSAPGQLSNPNPAKVRHQRELLRNEGVLVDAQHQVLQFEQCFIPVEELDSDIPPQTRPEH